MAANSGAYYEGLQYASKGVEPVKFGELALGFAKIVEDKRLQAKQEQEKKEAFQMEMTKLFGEEVYSAFDGTGLADVDIVNAKIKDSIVARANVVNSLYEDGKLSNAQMMQEMVKLNAQSKKYASFANSISDKVEEINKLGGDASEYTTLMLEGIDNLMQNATPVMDNQGNLSFLSKDGETVVQNPFNELQKLIDVRKKYDVDSIIDTVVKSRGTERVRENGQVVQRLIGLNENDETAFKNVINSLDAADKFDLAIRAGVEVERNPNRIFEITNEEEVDKGILEFMKSSANAKINQMKTVDEVAAINLNSKLEADYRAAKKFEQDTQGATVVVIGEKDEDQEMQVFPAQGKSVVVNSLIAGGKALPSASIGKYVVDKDGNHRATVSYKTMIDVPAEVGEGVEKKEVLVTEDITIEDTPTINQIRAAFRLPPVKDVPNTPKPPGY